MRKNKKAKVVIAMSGGVDSSVAAALLKKSGYNLVGVFMKFWTAPGAKNWNRCCSLESETRARLVAQALGIPFYVLDFKKEFKKRIIDSFLTEFKAGRTPNPCVICNKQIKFGLLLEKAKALGADFIVTGHYAEIRNGKLFKGKDKIKDQSYFLWQLNQNQLKRILFPVGSYVKKQVREMAEKMDLPTAKTPESQEICFIQDNLNDFLKKNLKNKPGKIIDKRGKILGRHQGLYFYTIGQRKNIEIPQGPWYVVKKDIKNNALIVSRREKDVFKKEMILKSVNWISGKSPKFPFRASVKIRYQHPGCSATIVSRNKIVFDKAQRAITPGQSAVFYKNREVIGGGIIL